MNANFHNSELPADLHEIAHSVDALGAADRAAAPEGFESRIHAASVSVLGPALRIAGNAEVVVRPMTFAPRRWLTPLRAAAAVAFLSTVGVAYLAINGHTPPTTIGQADPASAAIDMENWLTLSAPDDSVAAELDLLIADTERVREGIHKAPAADGGAM